MSDGVIRKIQLPDGNIYDIPGDEAILDSTYDNVTKTVTLVVGAVDDADDNEY